MLSSLTIRQKMLLMFVSVILGFVTLNYLIYSSETESKFYGKIETHVAEMKADMLMLRRNEKDFLLRNTLKYQDKFLKNYNISLQTAENLKINLDKVGFDSTEVKKYISVLGIYKRDFMNLVKTQKEIGLDEKSGLYGALRDSVHKV